MLAGGRDHEALSLAARGFLFAPLTGAAIVGHLSMQGVKPSPAPAQRHADRISL
jgi:hypothetical protein